MRPPAAATSRSGSTARWCAAATRGRCPPGPSSAWGWGPTSRATTSRRPPRRIAERLGADAVRHQGNWFPHRLRDAPPRTACSSSATAPATASRSRGRGSAPRSTSASPAAANCARAGRRAQPRGRRWPRYARLLARAPRPPSRARWRSSASSPRSRRACSPALLALMGRRRLSDRAYGWYLRRPPPGDDGAARSRGGVRPGDRARPGAQRGHEPRARRPRADAVADGGAVGPAPPGPVDPADPADAMGVSARNVTGSSTRSSRPAS